MNDMADVSWIKLDTGIFDNRKVKYLRRTDHGVEYVYIWIYLLTLAGKCNDGGKIYLVEGIPFPIDDLAEEMGVEQYVFEEALDLMEELRMIVCEKGFITIKDWEDHQNVDKLEEIREKNRARKARYDAKKKGNVTSNVTSNVTVTARNALDKDKEKEEELEKEKEDITEEKAKPSPPPRHKYGEFGHVLLSDDDMDKLKKEFPSDWEDWIRKVDEYKENNPKASYKNYLLTIRQWARRDRDRGNYGQSAGGAPGKNSKANEWAYLDNLI